MIFHIFALILLLEDWVVSETFRPQSVTLEGVEPGRLQKPNEGLFGVVNGRIKEKTPG